MIKPLLQDDAFLADVEAHRQGLALWWLGQSGWLVMCHGKGLLIDPYLSDSLTAKYASSDKPHVRITGRVVDPARLTGILAATSSHNHTDHLDAETLLPVWAANPQMVMVVAEANRAFAARRLGRPESAFHAIDAGDSLCLGPYTLYGIRSAHEHIAPEFIGLVIEAAGCRIYHPGDCVLYDGLAESLLPFHIDLALLPINGSLAERRVAGNFWGREAAWLARQINARLAVPMHYGMFEFNTVTPDEFVEHCARLGQPCRVLQNGERLDVPWD
jgi:L-ascorbate metabolism protein UlaG (beta-lactamase superfamily)